MSASIPDQEELPDAELELVEEPDFYVSVGDVVAEKYRVEQIIGLGGMGFVVSAKHVELEERFALKFLNEEFLHDHVAVERFTQEARAACRIRSEHVARVYDVGVHRGAPFLVMEHLDGRDLAAVLAETGPLRVEDAVEYTMHACEALAVAHRHGIVHRDIKPENLFLVEHEGLPSIKLLDFGISKIVPRTGQPASKLTGHLALGTPCYMSPEQIRRAASADERSDIWSLGAVLYELLAGTEAFRSHTITEVCAAVLERDPERLSELRSDVPPELADVVATCLEKDPAARFADVAELAAALLPFAPQRALLCVERSSSLMKSARRAHGTRQGSALAARWWPFRAGARRDDSGTNPPASEAPLARSIGGGRRSVASKGHGRAIAYGAFALVSLAAAAGLTLYPKRAALRAEERTTKTSALPAPPNDAASPMAATTGPASATTASAPAVAPAPMPSAMVGALPVARAGASRLSSSSDRATTQGGGVAPLGPRRTSSPPRSRPIASAQARSAASPEVDAARAPAVSAALTPAVELGY